MPKGLGLAPSFLYPAKAAYTRARSVAWVMRRPSPPAGLRILMYHRVSADRDELAVGPAAFTRQVQTLARAGYALVDVASAAARLAAGDDCSRVIALSFDDGYRDVAEHALPVLAGVGATATVFLATGVTDGRAAFTWYEQQPPLLSWREVADLDGGVFRFEAHTVTHPNLLVLDDDAARAEIVACKGELEGRLGRAVTVFSYPAGLYGDRERTLVGAAGFDYAVSCEPGVNLATHDPFALRRTQVDHRDSLLDFRAKIGGGHDAPPPLRAAWRRVRHGAA